MTPTERARARIVRAARQCIVCRERNRVGLLMCGPCSRSWDRDADRDNTFAAAVVWTAERAWKAAERAERRAKAAERRREKKRER